ncbi:MAG: rhomboid family intramembrane serine protease [Flavobacteriaceae bacterium]
MTNSHANPFKFRLRTLVIPLYSVLFLWIVLLLDFRFNLHLLYYGIYPRTLNGMIGIIASPFIHKGITHLANNSLPLFVLLLYLFYFYDRIAFKVLIQGTLLLGFLTWLIARPAYHIGASGVVYLLVSFIFFSGLLSKNMRLIAVSMIVVFLYGSLVWYMFPKQQEMMSWEGHLSGFIAGLVLALRYRRTLPKPFKYNWEENGYENDEFDNLFDVDGNFKPPKEDPQ